MQRDPVVAALNECSQATLRATNGHHRRWAVARCVRQLVGQGTSPTLAERCALASVAVAQAVNGLAEAAQSPVRIEQRINVAQGITRSDVLAAMAAAKEAARREVLADIQRRGALHG